MHTISNSDVWAADFKPDIISVVRFSAKHDGKMGGSHQYLGAMPYMLDSIRQYHLHVVIILRPENINHLSHVEQKWKLTCSQVAILSTEHSFSKSGLDIL